MSNQYNGAGQPTCHLPWLLDPTEPRLQSSRVGGPGVSLTATPMVSPANPFQP